MSQRQNLLFIMVDQLRYDSLGFTGCPVASTPNIDWLAGQSTWFEHAFTSIPTCCPARQSLLTGMRPETLGCHWNYDITLKIPSITPENFTWTQALKNQGYQMSYVGKWHVSPEYTPLDFGYDRYVSEGDHAGYIRKKYPELAYKEPFLGEVDPLPLEDTATHYLAAQAISCLEDMAAKEMPWHLRFDLSEPHLPCRPAFPFAGRVDPASLEPWGSFYDDFKKKPYIQAQQPISWGLDHMTWEDWAPAVARYHEITSQMDDAVGRVLERIKELGLWDNTTIIFTTDHGDMGGSHRMIDKHYVLYDDVTHVPMLIHAPGRTVPGSKVGGFTCHTLDLAPTMLEWMGSEIPDHLQGKSLWPLMAGQEQPGRDRVVSSGNGQQFGLFCSRMIRNQRYKYIWTLTDVDEFYDLEKDPWELHNLIDEEEYAPILAEMRRTLYEDLRAAGDPLASSWTSRQLLEGKKLGAKDRL